MPFWGRPEPLAHAIRGSYADPGAHLDQPVAYDWPHSLAEIVSAIAAAGLRIEFQHEFPFEEWHRPHWPHGPAHGPDARPSPQMNGQTAVAQPWAASQAARGAPGITGFQPHSHPRRLRRMLRPPDRPPHVCRSRGGSAMPDSERNLVYTVELQDVEEDGYAASIPALPGGCGARRHG